MAKKEFLKGSEEWLMFRDYYQLAKKFWIPEESDEYWEQVVKESCQFAKMYEDLGLSVKLCLAFIEYLETKHKEPEGMGRFNGK